MKTNQETFTVTNNPFIFKGVIGSLMYFLSLITFLFLRTQILNATCPQFISKISENQLLTKMSPLQTLLEFSPTNEILFFVFIILIFNILIFILNKKRILDIIGKEQNALRTAVSISIVLFILEILSILFSPEKSILNNFLLICKVTIFMIKGKITKSSPS